MFSYVENTPCLFYHALFTYPAVTDSSVHTIPTQFFRSRSPSRSCTKLNILRIMFLNYPLRSIRCVNSGIYVMFVLSYPVHTSITYPVVVRTLGGSSVLCRHNNSLSNDTIRTAFSYRPSSKTLRISTISILIFIFVRLMHYTIQSIPYTGFHLCYVTGYSLLILPK